MEHKLYPIFPTSVMKFKFNRNLNEIENTFIKKQESKSKKNLGNYHSLNTFVLNENEMNSIKEFCQKGLEEYFKFVYEPTDNVKINITQSWLNWTKKNEFHHGHEHPNSFISGVFYPSAQKNKDRICFQKSDYQQIKIPSKKTNDYNTDRIELLVETGDLVLFPSKLSHYVPFNETENRISIAFNSFVTGELGTIEGLNYLKI